MANGSTRRVSSIASVLLIAIGLLVLAGWAFDLQVLKGLFGQITMKPNAATGLLACGIALGALRTRHRVQRGVGRGCAVLAGALGAMTLCEHITGWDLGIDQLLFTEVPGAAATTSPGRMGPNSSLSLTFASIAIWCLYRGTRRGIVCAQLLGAAIGVFALVPTVGYIYGAQALYAVAKYTGIAFHTGLALLALSAGILTARPEAGPVAALTSDAPYGVMTRRLLAVAVLVPVVAGYLRILGERRGFYDGGLGAAILVVGMIVMLSFSIWRAALALGRSEIELREMEQEREELLVRERAARETAERADHAKDEFIAALSHELRTPLNAILGWMYMLQQETVPESARNKATHAVLRNAGVLSRLIEDLLDTSRITTGHMALSTSAVDLKSVAHSAVEAVLPAAAARNVDVELLSTPAPAVVFGDAQRLQQVIWNLVSNAIKFSPEGRKVTVAVRPEGGAIVVAVRDEGEGIDPAFLPYVFERLRQGDASTTRAQGGLGLGLFIAKHLTLLHGGTLDVHSEGTGKGAVFTVRLPAASAHQVDSRNANIPAEEPAPAADAV